MLELSKECAHLTNSPDILIASEFLVLAFHYSIVHPI